jgi:diguanylate cyclase (GGDEF)-like protein
VLGTRVSPRTALTEPSTHRQQMERALAAMFLAGATIALASMLLPHWPGTNDAVIAVAAAQGYPMALVLFRARGRLPTTAIHAFLVAATALVSIGVYFAHGAGGSATVAIFYVWVALYAFHFFSRTAAIAHVALVGVAYAIVLAVLDEEGGASQWLFVVGTVAVTGVIVASLSDQVRVLARRDSLTGLGNRRAWDEALPRELARAQREAKPLCVALVDLDTFKDVNDQRGHQEGDRYLAEAARSWNAELRASDLLTRYGGDEFAVLLPDCSTPLASEIVERLRASLDGLEFSAGVAEWDSVEDAESLLRRADRALYRAKQEGGNRTTVSASL